MQLSSDVAKDMYILPTELLHQVHSSIIYFSKEANSQGMAIAPLDFQPDTNRKSKKKLPGPMICAHLLELIGIPHHYLHVSLNNSKPTTIHVHSSQIDFILECCMETVVALSRSCEVGRHSLIGTDFNNNGQTTSSPGGGDKKTAAQLCEEIWRSIYNIEIKYTSKRTTNTTPSDTQLPQQQVMKIGRIGSLQMNTNSIVEYLSAMNFDKQKDDECEFIDELEGTSWETLKPTESSRDEDDILPWTAKDQRRYDKATILFNSTLSSYAKLSSSMSGLSPQVRKDFVQTCERLLLEVAAKRDEIKDPSPNTILQCIQPNVVSFNTALSAWSSFSSKQRRTRGRQQDDRIADDSVATAERTQSILKVMEDVNDDTRSNRNTVQSIESAWTERRGHNAIDVEHFTRPTTRVISPNTTSFNNVLKALSRTSNTNETALQSLNIYQTIMNRANKHHHARENLVLDNCEQLQKRSIDPGRARDILPDSRTLVLLLINLQNLSLSNFQDSLAVVNSIYQSMLQLDDQLQWSVDNLQESSRSALLNKYSFNAILKTLSSLSVDSYDDSYECATQIDAIVEQAVHEYSIKSSDIRPNAIKSWIKCALLAGTDKERLHVCASKCGAHIEALFAELNQTKDVSNTGSYHLIQAINDTISLYGRVGLFFEAHTLYKEAQSCDLTSLKTLSTTTEALCQARDIEQIDKAKELLLDYEQEIMGKQSSTALPDMKYTYIYNSLIEAYLNSGTSRGLEEAHSLLSYMISSHESNLRHIARPNTTSFVIVMAALAQRGQHIHRLETLLAKMEEMSQRKKNASNDLVANVKPNNVVYNIMLKGYSLSKDNETLDSAMKLLDRMETDSDIKPLDSVSNTYVLDLLSRKDSADNVRNANTSRGSNLNSQSQDSVESFNSIIKGVTTVEDAEKGEALLQQIEERYRNGKSEIKPGKSITLLIYLP